MSCSSVDENGGQLCMARLARADRKATVAQITTLLLLWEKKHLKMHVNAWGPQEQKTKSGFTSVSQEQETGAAVGTRQLKANKKSQPGLMNLDFSRSTQMVESEFAMDQTCLVLIVQGGEGAVMFSLHTLLMGLLIPINSHLNARCLYEYCCWFCASLYGHKLPIF